MDRMVAYMAHPVAPTPEEIAADAMSPTPHADAIARNIRRACRWLSWLRRSFPHVTFVAPWIASIVAGEDDSDPSQREAGLIDSFEIVMRCDVLVHVGGRVSDGMAMEGAHAALVSDLTWLGVEPPSELYCAAHGQLDVPWLIDHKAEPDVGSLADFACDGIGGE